MSGTKRRMFGPLLYVTLAVSVVALGFGKAGPRIANWNESRQLAAALGSPNPSERESAGQNVSMLEPEAALTYWRVAVHHPRKETRILACQALANTYNQWSQRDYSEISALLCDATRDPEPEVQQAAVVAIGALPSAARGTVSSSDKMVLPDEVRRRCLHALRSFLKDQDIMIRDDAVRALGEFGPDPTTAADLVAATSDVYRPIRLTAARSLLKIHGPEDKTAIDLLIATIGDLEPIGDRQEALAVLADGGSPGSWDRAIAKLIELLNTGPPDIIPDVIACLGSLGSQTWSDFNGSSHMNWDLSDLEVPARAALPALEARWKAGDPELRAMAATAMIRLLDDEDPRSTEILTSILADEAQQLKPRYNALEVLLAKADKGPLSKASKELVRQLGDPDLEVRFASMQLLQAIISTIPAELPGAVGSPTTDPKPGG